MSRFHLGWSFLAILLAAQLALAAPDAGLLGQWTFDEGAGDLAADNSGQGNTGDLMDAAWAKGAFGSAARLAGGTGCVAVPQLAGLDGSDQLTVEAWVLWEDGGRYPNIVTGGRWAPGGFMIFVADRSCSFRMGRPDARPGDPTHPWQETSAPLVTRFETGKWYHLAATFHRPLITTYVNGKPVGTARWDYPVGYQGDLLIGGGWGRLAHKGLIDDVKVFRRALSADEVRASYAAESPRRTSPQAVAYQAVPAASQPIATIENSMTRLEIDARGRATALIEKRSGRNLLTAPAPLATVKVQNVTLRPRVCTYADGKLRFGFGKGRPTVVLGCASKAKYLTFTVLGVEGPGVDALTFVALPVQPGTRFSSTSGAVTGDDWGVCLRGLNLQAEIAVSGGLRAICTPEYGTVGSKVALLVAPFDQLRPALQDMVRTERMPHSALGGPAALDAEGTRGSYLFAHCSEHDVERWIDLAKRGGFTCVHHDGWYRTLGHYEPSPSLFPSGLEGIKSMVRKIHAAGLKAGMHTLTGCIQPNDSWVSPVPDKRLAADASYTLAAAMDERSDTVLTVEKPQAHDVIWSYAGRGNAIRMGDEIIQYAAISTTPPYGFLKCTRGAFKTKPSAHRKGDPVDHLRQIYIAFYPDERSTLVGEVADAIARVYNECQFDQIYMDGSEGMGSLHAIQTMRNAIYERLRRPAIVEASCWDHWSWYFHSRIGAWDHPKWGLKQFTDLHCAAIDDYRRGALLQAQLGWWVVLGASPAGHAETPDEMEYFCAKALGFDAPSSTQGIGALTAPTNARMQEYLTRAGWYERLRLANYFSESVKQQLREPGKDFHLVRADDGRWQLLPTDYLAHKVTGLDNGTQRWTVDNRFAAQPLKLRLEALFAVEPYDSPDAVLVADAGSLERFTTQRTARDVRATLSRSTAQVKQAPASLCFTATNQGASRRGAWAHAGLPFEPYLSIQPCDALGVWIHGDGKGELLNLQLTTPREYMVAYGEHYVTIDFTGWRYFELPLRERSAAQYRDHQWPYNSLSGIYMTAVNRSNINGLNLYLNNLPSKETATVYLGPIKALRTGRQTLNQPTLEVNGQRLALPTTLTSGDYVELAAADDCRVYNERGTLLARLALSGPLPQLQAGANRIAFACARPEKLAARAEVTLVAHGPALEGQTPAHQVKWQLLRDEYDAPHVVTRLDGRDNAWDVFCRKDAKPLSCSVEIDVEQVKTSDAAYRRPDAIPLEGFDTPAWFDTQGRIAGVRPGVTQTIDRCTKQVKIGQAAARYAATSTLSDASGWSACGRRWSQPLDLSKAQALGFWLYGDGRGEAFKLQLRDSGRGWCDMVTHVDFVGWRYVQFDFNRPGNLDRAKVQQMLIYYNGIPARQTVTCWVDEIRALPTIGGLGLKHPQMTVGGRQLRFPTELAPGDRLVFDGSRCRVHRAGKPEVEWFAAEGGPLTLQPGRNRVSLAFDAELQPEFRVGVSLVKHYP